MTLPTDFPNLTYWLVGDDATLTAWPDASGNIADLTTNPPTPSSADLGYATDDDTYPPEIVAAPNGHNALYVRYTETGMPANSFGSAGHQGYSGVTVAPASSSIFPNLDALHIFLVVRFLSGPHEAAFPGLVRYVLGTGIALDNWEFSFEGDLLGGPGVLFDGHSGDSSVYCAANFDTWCLIEISQDFDGVAGTLSIKVHDLDPGGGVPSTTLTAPRSSFPPTLDAFQLGGGGVNNSGDAQYAELVVYSEKLSCADANSIRSYLGTKYGLTVELEFCECSDNPLPTDISNLTAWYKSGDYTLSTAEFDPVEEWFDSSPFGSIHDLVAYELGAEAITRRNDGPNGAPYVFFDSSLAFDRDYPGELDIRAFIERTPPYGVPADWEMVPALASQAEWHAFIIARLDRHDLDGGDVQYSWPNVFGPALYDHIGLKLGQVDTGAEHLPGSYVAALQNHQSHLGSSEEVAVEIDLGRWYLFECIHKDGELFLYAYPDSCSGDATLSTSIESGDTYTDPSGVDATPMKIFSSAYYSDDVGVQQFSILEAFCYDRALTDAERACALTYAASLLEDSCIGECGSSATAGTDVPMFPAPDGGTDIVMQAQEFSTGILPGDLLVGWNSGFITQIRNGEVVNQIDGGMGPSTNSIPIGFTLGAEWSSYVPGLAISGGYLYVARSGFKIRSSRGYTYKNTLRKIDINTFIGEDIVTFFSVLGDDIIATNTNIGSFSDIAIDGDGNIILAMNYQMAGGGPGTPHVPLLKKYDTSGTLLAEWLFVDLIDGFTPSNPPYGSASILSVAYIPATNHLLYVPVFTSPDRLTVRTFDLTTETDLGLFYDPQPQFGQQATYIRRAPNNELFVPVSLSADNSVQVVRLSSSGTALQAYAAIFDPAFSPLIPGHTVFPEPYAIAFNPDMASFIVSDLDRGVGEYQLGICEIASGDSYVANLEPQDSATLAGGQISSLLVYNPNDAGCGGGMGGGFPTGGPGGGGVPTGCDAPPLAGLQLWLNPDHVVGFNDGEEVSDPFMGEALVARTFSSYNDDPIYHASGGANNKAYIAFENDPGNTAESLSVDPPDDILDTSAWAVFIAFKVDVVSGAVPGAKIHDYDSLIANTDGNTIRYDGVSTGWNQPDVPAGPRVAAFHIDSASSESEAPVVFTVNAWTALEASWDHARGAFTYEKAGATRAMKNTADNGISFTANTPIIGYLDYSTPEAQNILIGDILVYDHILTTEDRALVQAYFFCKYGFVFATGGPQGRIPMVFATIAG